MTRVAGVDGCAGGWALVTATAAGDRLVGLRLSRVIELAAVVDRTRTGELAALAIDMPIGLLDVHPRTADVEARKRLGPRRSSVFPTPLRTTLDAADYPEACERSRAMCGKALSKQAWNLMPKIRELDRIVEATDQPRVAEAHPECAFLRLHDDQPLPHPKATPQGRELRVRLLTDSGRFDQDELAMILASGNAPLIDTLDALALTVTARHITLGTERRLGDQADGFGRRAEIVF